MSSHKNNKELIVGRDDFARKVFLKDNVYDMALKRIHWLFDEFKSPVVDFSGGKDSTVLLHLCLKVAEERGRLPLRVLFIDQEAEWDMVINYVRRAINDPRIKPYWLQCPIKLFNATSHKDQWLHCWDKNEEWMREKEPNSVHENIYGTDRFTVLFGAFLSYYWPNEPACHIAGVRTEESPARALGLTGAETYKGETWGKVRDKKRKHFDMYPIYDWKLTDVWKTIHDHDLDYCPIYDYMYQYGVPSINMRVSNVHHETAIHSLHFLQEIEPEMWNRLTARLSGINTVGQLKEAWAAPRQLPWMFKDWFEYRDHLLENMITDPIQREKYRETFAAYDARYEGDALADLVKTEIATILVNDSFGTKLGLFRGTHFMSSKNRGKRSGRGW